MLAYYAIFSFLDNISINIPYKGLVHEFKLNWDKFNAYLGYIIKNLNVQDRTWNQEFLDRHAYPKEGRARLANEFVTVK